MSMGIWPVFNPAVRTAYPRCTGEVLAKEHEGLDLIADLHRLKRFSDFGDNREIPDGFDGSPDDLEDLLGPFDEWFEVAEGLAVFGALVELIETDASAARLVRRPKRTAKELKDLIRVLKIAEKYHAKFHLELLD